MVDAAGPGPAGLPAHQHGALSTIMAPTALLMVTVAAFCTAQAEDIGDGYVPPPNVEAQPGDPALMTGYSLVEAAHQPSR